MFHSYPSVAHKTTELESWAGHPCTGNVLFIQEILMGPKLFFFSFIVNYTENLLQVTEID